MSTFSKPIQNKTPNPLQPSPALLSTYIKSKTFCPTPKYILAREKANAKEFSKMMRKLHDKRIARFESFTSLYDTCNDKAVLQPMKEIFEMSNTLSQNLQHPCPSKVQSFETLYAFIAEIATKFKNGVTNVTEFVTSQFTNIICAIKSFITTATKVWNFAKTAHDMINNTIGYNDLLYVFGFFIIYCLLALTPFELLGRTIFLTGLMFSSNKYIVEASKFLTAVSVTWMVSQVVMPKMRVEINTNVARVQGFMDHPFISISFVLAALVCGGTTFAFEEKTYLSFVK
jgi:hypothetical protein